MQEYIYRSAHELARLIREGQATSVEIVKQHVARIKERNEPLNALVSLFEEEALAVAAERDRQAQMGTFLGPLHAYRSQSRNSFGFRARRARSTRRFIRISSPLKMPSWSSASERAAPSSLAKDKRNKQGVASTKSVLSVA